MAMCVGICQTLSGKSYRGVGLGMKLGINIVGRGGVR